MQIVMPPIDTRVLPQAEYRKQYNKGWRASGGNPKAEAPMDVAEARFLSRNGFHSLSAEHHAWIDGWLDFATGRERYHFETCDGENHTITGEVCDLH